MHLNGPIILVVVLLLLVILVLSLYARHLAGKDLRLFQEIAKRRKGKIVFDSFTSWATVVFPYKEWEVTVFQQKGIGGKRFQTSIKCYLNMADYYSLHVAKATSGQPSVTELGQWFLVPKRTVGSEAFNKEFVIHGNDQDFLQRIFTPDFQKRFIAANSKYPSIYLHSQKQSFYRDKKGQPCKHLLEYSIREVPNSVEGLEKVIDDGLQIIDNVLQLKETV
jgi:hypothetical protein